MKFKMAYLYIILGLGVVVTLFILAGNNNEPDQPSQNISDQQIPNDKVHKGLQNPMGGNPSKSNVSQEVYEKMDRLKKEVEAQPNDTLKMREYADFMAAAHRPDEAIIYYNKILEVNPHRNDILFGLSMIFYSRQDYQKAEDYTNRILKSDKNNTQALYNLGAIAASKGEKDRAKSIWNKLITEYPGDQAAELARSSLQKF